MTRLLVDTGFLFAVADDTDAWHERAREWQDGNRSDLLIPVSVVTEICYFMSKRFGHAGENAILRSIEARELLLTAVGQPDIERIVELAAEYSDAGIGFVDASIVAVAERLDIKTILTTDRRHFSAIRPRHCRSFQLLP